MLSGGIKTQKATARALVVGASHWQESAAGWDCLSSIGDGQSVADGCAVALAQLRPVVNGDPAPALLLPTGETTVLRLHLASGPGVRGAAEAWCSHEHAHELHPYEGWYPGLDRFGRASRHVRFPCGTGMPGLAWERAAPILLDDLVHSPCFLRSSGAAIEGIRAGLALPIIDRSQLRGVGVLLCSIDLPIARLVELWRNDNGRLQRIATYGEAVASRSAVAPLADADDAFLGSMLHQPQTLLHSGSDCLGARRAAAAAEDGLSWSAAIPVIHAGAVRAVTLIAG
jgi:hypothetical protein